MNDCFISVEKIGLVLCGMDGKNDKHVLLEPVKF